MVPLPVVTYAHYRRVVQRYIEPAVHLHRDAATRRDLFRDLSERLTETYYRQPALVDDDDAAATQARRAASRSSTGEWDLEALGEPELPDATPLVRGCTCLHHITSSPQRAATATVRPCRRDACGELVRRRCGGGGEQGPDERDEPV